MTTPEVSWTAAGMSPGSCGSPPASQKVKNHSAQAWQSRSSSWALGVSQAVTSPPPKWAGMPPCQLWTARITLTSHIFCYSLSHPLFVICVSDPLGALQALNKSFPCIFFGILHATVWHPLGAQLSKCCGDERDIHFLFRGKVCWAFPTVLKLPAMRRRQQWDPDHLMYTCQLLLCLGCCLWSSRCELVFWLYGSNYYMFLAAFGSLL